MSESASPDAGQRVADLGDYCRRVEEHLARLNGGHLIRIVGPGFELVRAWAHAGLPLSVVCRGIDMKAERHRAGRSKRPLRLEFCEADVQEVYDDWRRAVGVRVEGESPRVPNAQAESGRTRPPLTRHVDRAMDRLASVSGRLDLSEAFRDVVARVLTDLGSLRDDLRRARGAAREPLAARLAPLDEELIRAARGEAGEDTLGRLGEDAAADLAPYRTRLSPDAWQRSLDLSVDRLLRDRLGLPTLTL